MVVEMVIIEEGESTVVIVVGVVEEEEGGGDNNNNNVGRHVDEIIEIHLPRYYHPVHHQEILQIMIQEEDVVVRYFCPARKLTLSKRNINEQKVHKLPRTDSLNDLLVDHPTILVESKSSFKGVVLLEESVKYLSKVVP